MNEKTIVDLNPQAELMGDESMARNLAHQANAIWPQEISLFDRYQLAGPIRILDLGCGTGEITVRLAQRFVEAKIVGVDILESNLDVARQVNPDRDGRIVYQVGNAFELDFADAEFDLVVCRHVSQAIPNFDAALKEMTRVLKPRAWLHLLSEDYGMLHMPTRLFNQEAKPLAGFDPDQFWNLNAIAFLTGIGCDGRIGRHSPALLSTFDYQEISLNYLTVDTLRVPRSTFAGIIRAWKDGYSQVLADASSRKKAEVEADFDRLLYAIETPPNYAVWHIPLVAGRKP